MRDVLKLVRDLVRRKARERRGAVLLEGRRLVEDAVEAEAKMVALLAADDADAEPLLNQARSLGADVQVVERKLFDGVAETDTPSGVIGVADWEPLTIATLPQPGARSIALILDAVQDPGNVGTMIRTGHALGAWCTIALDGTADVRGPKVMRGAMGSHFRHPVAAATFDEVSEFIRTLHLDVRVADAHGTPLLSGPDPGVGAAAALVVGSEGHGTRPAWSTVPHRRVSIPMHRGAESLNAAVAAGILLFELTHARR